MLLTNLFEEISNKGKTAVLGWGRGMGHKGHMLLAKAVIHHAQENNAKAYFVVSRTSLVDPATGQPWADRPTFTKTKDDPLTPEEKLATYRKVFPQNAEVFSVATPDASTLDKVLANIAKDGFSKVILIVGEQEKASFSFLTNPDKSGVPPYQRAGLTDLEIISRQDTTEPSSVKDSPDYQEGPRATPMRQVLLDPSKSEEEQFAVWRRDMPDNLSDEEVKNLMLRAKQRMSMVPLKKGAAPVNESVKPQASIIFDTYNPPDKDSIDGWKVAAKTKFWFVGTDKKRKDSKNPLPYEIKLVCMETAWPRVKAHIKNVNNLLELAAEAYKETGEIELFVCTNKESEYKKVLQYNGHKGPHGYYDFERITRRAVPYYRHDKSLKTALLEKDKEAFKQATGIDPEKKIVANHVRYEYYDLLEKFLIKRSLSETRLIELEETVRMSAAVKLQRAWDQQQAKSTASRKRGEEYMAQIKQDVANKNKKPDEPKDESIMGFLATPKHSVAKKSTTSSADMRKYFEKDKPSKPEKTERGDGGEKVQRVYTRSDESILSELDMFAPRTVYFKMADGNYIKADYRGSEGLTGHKANDTVTFTGMSWVPVNTARSLGLDKFLAKGSDPATTVSQNAQNIVGTSSAGEGPFGNRTIDVVDFVNGKEDTVPSELKTQVMQWVEKNTPQQQQGVAGGNLKEFAPGSGGDDDEDPYKYPKPESYRRSIDFFGQFEADHFDREDFDDDTGVFKGYWGSTQIAYFKFSDPTKTSGSDSGMGWYYEPTSDNKGNSSSAKPTVDNSDERKQQELSMINQFLKSGNRPNPDSQIGRLMKKYGMAEGASNAMANAASRLSNKDDGKVAKLRAAGDKRREDQLKGRDIAKRDTTSKDEWGNLKEKIKGADGKACWKGKRYAGTENGKDKCIPVSESIEDKMASLIRLLENK